jgi:hypothetical protein
MTDINVFEIEVSLSETILERISIIRHASVPFFCDRSSSVEYEVLDKSCYHRGGM